MTAAKRCYRTTVVFADVSGSSSLYQGLGAQAASTQIGQALGRLTQVVTANNGIVIKTLGDEIMCHFPNADDVCVAAAAFAHIGEDVLPIHVGISSGEVIEDNGDLFGCAVNDAAAVARISRAGQVLATESFRNLLSPTYASQWARYDEVTLKGAKATTGIYRLEWAARRDGADTISEHAKPDPEHTIILGRTDTGQGELTLSYESANGQGDTITVTPEDVPLTIGRDHSACHLSLPTALASRNHCRIDYQYGKFVLADHSTNGTYVRNERGQQVYLRREELPLMGSGEIGLGERVDEGNRFVIKFVA